MGYEETAKKELQKYKALMKDESVSEIIKDVQNKQREFRKLKNKELDK